MEKQLGCMNGIFQLFDRHHFLTGRRASGHNQKKLPPGPNSSHGTERNYSKDKFPENVLETGKEKHRVQVESSRSSCSSSCSSTFSSVDCNKLAQREPPSFCQSIVPEIPATIVPKKQENSSLRLSQQSLDLREVVKDSMYREARGISVKTMGKDEERGHALKQIDSPRPLQQSQAVQLRVRSSDGPSRGFAKLREAPRNLKEEKNGCLPSAQKDARRLSYDGRETRDAWKTNLKVKELPRLSLDSKDRSMRSSDSESRSNYISRNTHGENVNSSQLLNTDQEPGSNKRPSTIVARLMGLEAFPDPTSTAESQMVETSHLDQNLDTIPRSSRIEDGSKQNQVSRSPRVPHEDAASPRSRNANPNMTPTSRFPLEPAPWKQADNSRGSRKSVFKASEAPKKTPNAASSVYGEIEKRLTDLEFKKSGKDLRALKQILEAMQKTREKLENRLEDQPSSVESQTSGYSPDYSCFEKSKLATNHSQQSNHPVSPTIKGTSPPNRYGSAILIVKPAKMMERPNSSIITADGMSGLRKLRMGDTANRKIALVDRLTAKSPSPRNNHLIGRPLPSTDKKANAKTPPSSISSRAPQKTSVSPRLQQNKYGMEKQSHPTTPASNLNRTRRQSSKQTVDSSSVPKRQKPKSANSQQNDQSSGFSEDGNLIYHGDTVSLQSESKNSMDSGIDTEVTSADCTNEINEKQHPKNFAARLSEDRSIPELARATLEQPSPVSVLDATFYGEDSPSPVKKISNAFGDDETLNCNESEWSGLDIDHLRNRLNLSSERADDKLENIKQTVRNLRLVNSADDKATIYGIACPCENTNPDQEYITELLLASDFLKDLGSSKTTIQLHPSGHLIKPNVFHALEKIKGGIELTNDQHHDKTPRAKSNEKLRRKLVFDTVNELLVHKLVLAGFVELWMFPNKMGGTPLSREKLLKELWSEINHLQPNPECNVDDEEDGLIRILTSEMMNQSEDWTNHRDELPGLVLDIERLIFKDLISEIVSGEAVALQDRPGRHCRQLF